MHEDLKRELKAFDNKVYNASEKLVGSMSAELKQLGVPFFGVQPDLVITLSRENKVPSDSTFEQRAGLSRGKVSKSDLLELQRKMIQYLEDMYRD